MCLSLSLSLSLCMCLFFLMLVLTDIDSLYLLLSFMDVLLYDSILAFFILFYSSSVFKRNPVFNLAPSSVIVSNKLTWFVTNCCVCFSIVCEEHVRWQDLCRSWLQRHHQSLAMRICLPFAPGTSAKGIAGRWCESVPLYFYCLTPACERFFRSNI